MVPRIIYFSFASIALLVFSGMLVACNSSSDREKMLEATVTALQIRIVQSESPIDADLAPQTPDTILPTSSPASNDTVSDSIGIAFDNYMRDHEKPFSGTIMVVRDGVILIKKGYGLADREQDVPNSPETKFAIGSITKSFTAAAIMLLQERGKLSVEDSICKYISECPEIWEPITLHHLLTHSSGIRNYDELGVAVREEVDACTEYEPEEVIPFFREHQLLYTPGSKFHYSNSGYYLLGVVIEEVSNQSYDAYIDSEILLPLEMTETGYDRSSDIVVNRASGYSLDGITYKYRNAPCWDVSQKYAAGGLFSTVEDLYKWDQALLSDNLLSEESLKAMHNSSGSGPWVFENTTAGYGWIIADDLGRRLISHGGQVNGFTAHLARYPDDQVTVIILSNFEGEVPSRISENLAGIIFGEN